MYTHNNLNPLNVVAFYTETHFLPLCFYSHIAHMYTYTHLSTFPYGCVTLVTHTVIVRFQTIFPFRQPRKYWKHKHLTHESSVYANNDEKERVFTCPYKCDTEHSIPLLS